MSALNDYLAMHDLEMRIDVHNALNKIKHIHSNPKLCNDGSIMRVVLYRRYWLNHTLKSIADDMGKTPERIRQIECRAIRMLKYRFFSLEERQIND